MMLSRAALRSALRTVSGSGCPVTGSLVLRGSIGPLVTLRLPLPLAGMLCVWVCVGLRLLLCACGGCVAVSDLCAWLQPVCPPAAGCGAGGVGVILLWIGRLCGLEFPPWTNALEAPHW